MTQPHFSPDRDPFARLFIADSGLVGASRVRSRRSQTGTGSPNFAEYYFVFHRHADLILALVCELELDLEYS